MHDYLSQDEEIQKKAGLLRGLMSPWWNWARSSWGQWDGFSFRGKRDWYEALGYTRHLTPTHYRARYERNGVARRIVESFPNSTWRGELQVIEDEDPKVTTAFEKAFEDLDKKLQIKRMFERVDILAGLGRYAILFLGGPGNVSTPLEKCNEKDLMYLVPYSEEDATVSNWEQDPENERYSQPTEYNLIRRQRWMTNMNTQPPDVRGRVVHYTRCIHIADGLLDDHVFGVPRLMPVWNLLDDLDKVIGGGAEAFWKRADGGMHFDIDKDLVIDPDPKKAEQKKDEMQKKFDEFTHELRKNLVTRGINVTRLGSDVADIKGPAGAVMDQISAATGIPQRILMGSEMGHLASTQDKSNYDDRIEDRRNSFAEWQVVRPFVDKMIDLGVLPEPKQYRCEWPVQDEMTQMQRVTASVQVTMINKNNGTPVVAPSEIRTKYLGLEPFSDEQLTELQKLQEEKDARNPLLNPPPGAPTPGAPEPKPGLPAPKPDTIAELETALSNDDFALAQEIVTRALQSLDALEV